jgi:hypothetical protein
LKKLKPQFILRLKFSKAIMSKDLTNYPPTPENVDEHVLAPSSTFKQEVFKALAAILFFVLVYIALMAAGVGLAILCALGGGVN